MKGPGGSKQCSILNVSELWPSLSLSEQKRLLVLDPQLIPSQRICLLLCLPRLPRRPGCTARASLAERLAAEAWRCVFDKSASPRRWFSLPTRVCSADSADGGADSSAIHPSVTQTLLCCPCPSAQGHQTSPRAASEPVTPQQHCAWTASVPRRPQFEKCLLKLGNTFSLLQYKQQRHSMHFCGERGQGSHVLDSNSALMFRHTASMPPWLPSSRLKRREPEAFHNAFTAAGQKLPFVLNPHRHLHRRLGKCGLS